MEIPEASKLRKRQPVHRNLAPPLKREPATLEVRLQQSATSCGCLLLSILLDHLLLQ